MGVAYFIVLEEENPSFETFVNGKAVARARDSLYAITETLGLTGIDDLCSWARLDRVFDVPHAYRETTTPWFEPQEGIEWVGAVRRYIESNRSSVAEPDRVLSDLEEYDELFRKAAAIGTRWHFEMDV